MTKDCGKRRKTEMTAAQNVLLRISIVLGMVAAVVTILYFTPMPDQNFKSCDRPCHDLDWPMICRVKLNLEMYQTMSGVCEDCPFNATHCTNKYCASADGGSRPILTANRHLPGPSIQVCQNDILVVDVINKIPGHSVTVHWRGQPNNENPFMDGVPMVTQCPILSYTTFQYKFRASAPGTHFYHAFADSDRSDGIFGAFIVKQADKIEPQRRLYDYDLKEHVILLSEWSDDLTINSKSQVKSVLINGRAPSEMGTSLAVFNVKKGRRYRFRLAYTGGNSGCPITVTIDGHNLKIIALDGNPTNPYEVSSVTLGKGERIDFVIKTNQDIGHYFIKTKSNCTNNPIDGLAVLSYEGAITKEKPNRLEKIRNFHTSLCESQIGEVCLRDVRSLYKLPEELRIDEVSRRIYLVLDVKLNENKTEGDLRQKFYTINNITFTYPSSPLLTQLNDVAVDSLCNELNIPQKCQGLDHCECIHLEYIPLGATTEIILIDQGKEDEQIFHMHGYEFYIVGSRQFDVPLTVEEVKALDQKNQLYKRNLNNPPQKDTVRVPKNGVVSIRFIANNPGFWMLRDEKSKGWTRGMDIVFQVGDVSEMVSTPSNFPTCGSFIGPDFFLM